ncbi:hypothetical protein L1987_04069 [Smallanthus sonchifolius]|uniref:Uncharacterized protein n=1 Tax=Smallanthus sonchifolius TaxID=185202 RepID=A0ACB9KCE7_9ASTR|nr:hypothetical protein L1987_04069 [Smallanthus sonchifolius]
MHICERYTTSTGNGSFEDGSFKSRSSLSKCVISGKVFRLCYVSKLLRRISKSTSKIFINSVSYMRISGKKSVIRKSTNTKHPILQAGILNVLHLPTGKNKGAHGNSYTQRLRTTVLNQEETSSIQTSRKRMRFSF